MSDELHDQHVALCRRVAEHLAVAAGKLTRTEGSAKLSPQDVGSLFLTTGCNVLLHEHGTAAAAAHLRALADRLEADAPRAN